MFIKISKILLKHIGIEISRNYDPKLEFKKMQYIFLPTLQTHPKTFEKYKWKSEISKPCESKK